TETSGKTNDPWDLVERAVSRMTTRGDVMRSDRLKQVMLELDARFSEGNFGFSKFSKFVGEAAHRGLVRLHKLENGQYEVRPGSGRKGADDLASAKEPKERRRPAARRGSPARTPRGRKARGDDGAESRDTGPLEAKAEPEASIPVGEPAGEPLRSAYDLMARCLQNLQEMGKSSARDSDVKRKMLAADARFDEGELGFGKFSRFLLQAEEHGVISLEQTERGNYRVSLAGSVGGGSQSVAADRASESGERPSTPETPARESASRGRGTSSGGRLGPRGGSGGRREVDDGPVLLEGQIVGDTGETPDRSSAGNDIDIGGLGLPTNERAIVSYLTNSYGGVGKKTAESLVEAFGADIFVVFETEPGRIAEIVPRRAPQVLAGWRADFARRSEKSGNEQAAAPGLDGASEPDRASEPERGPAESPETGSLDVISGFGVESVEPRSGGARRRTRRSPRRPSSSGSDE
ncbi:MAG: hypothetical protein VYB51_02155, partial [Gemmatimonadota bacterium]|nr:hypothetical protein [Gemmatimonadota bacterium]